MYCLRTTTTLNRFFSKINLADLQKSVVKWAMLPQLTVLYKYKKKLCYVGRDITYSKIDYKVILNI